MKNINNQLFATATAIAAVFVLSTPARGAGVCFFNLILRQSRIPFQQQWPRRRVWCGCSAYRRAVLSRAHDRVQQDARVLDVWYESLDAADLLPTIRNEDTRPRAKKRLEKERERSALEHDFPELARKVGGKAMIRDNPPTIYHSTGELARDEFHARVRDSFARYRRACRRRCVWFSTTSNSRTRLSKWSVLAA